MMQRIAAFAILASGWAVAALADHATPGEIKDAQARIDALDKQLVAAAASIRGPGEIRAAVNKTLFDDLNTHLQSLPAASRSGNLTILSAQGTFHNDDSGHSGLPFGCGYELKLNSMSGHASATLDEIQWVSPGALAAKVHVQGDVAANIGLHINAPPCPDIVCQVGQRRVEWEICIPYVGCYKDYKDVPWPECTFRGWTSCDAHCLGGGFQLGSIGALGHVDHEVAMTMTPSRLEPLDHPVAQLYGEHPGTSVADAAAELAVTPQQVIDSQARLSHFNLFDGTKLTDTGKAFAPGAGVGFAFDTKSTSKVPLDLQMTVPIPTPVAPFQWFCDNVPGVHEVCKLLNLSPLLKSLTPPDIKVSVNDLITACNMSFCMQHPVEYPAIDIPPLAPGGVALYGVGDTLVNDPQAPAGSFELPTSGRPIRAEGYATNLRADANGIAVTGEINVGWMDTEQWTDYLQAHFIDVGQGDATLVRYPRRIEGRRGEFTLIDGGPDRDGGGLYGERNRLELYLRFFNVPLDGAVDTVVVTHAHRDHFRGLTDFLKTASVRQLIVSGKPSWSLAYRRLLSTARKRGIQVVDASAVPASTTEGVRFEVLSSWHKGQPLGLFETATSNSSVVTRIQYREHSMLFMGDALGRRGTSEPAYIEQALLASPGPAGVNATLLKLGDHGSRRVGGDLFLRAVDPDIVTVSAGRQRRWDGFTPAESTLARIGRTLPDSTILTTALDDESLDALDDFDADDIYVTTDGHRLRVWQLEYVTGVPKRKWTLRRQVDPKP